MLLNVETYAGRDKLEPDWIWEGVVPLRCSLADVYPEPPTIGPDALFDLFAIAKGNDIMIFPIIKHSDLDVTWSADAHLRFTIQAHSNEADSPKVSVPADWDGGWGDTEAERDKH